MRITCSSPEALVYASNQLAMCLAYGPADGETYVGLNWQDADGNLYAATSFEARDEWVVAAQSPLIRPAWDVDEIIDMVAAESAQAVLAFSTEAILASPAALTAMGGPNGPEALTAMGLSSYNESEANG